MIYALLSVKENSDKLKVFLDGIKGIAGVNLIAISTKNISAIAGEIVDKNLKTDKDSAIEYANVIEKLSQFYTLLPMRFGSLLDSAEDIINMLDRNYNEIEKNLNEIENKFEFGLKIFCDSDKLREELKLKLVDKIPLNTDSDLKYSQYRNYINKKLEEHRLEESLMAYIDSVIAEITKLLGKMKAIYKFKKMTTEITIIDAVFLLEKDRKDTLIKGVEKLQNQYKALNFVLTGPWPPYNFVEITMK